MTKARFSDLNTHSFSHQPSTGSALLDTFGSKSASQQSIALFAYANQHKLGLQGMELISWEAASETHSLSDIKSRTGNRVEDQTTAKRKEIEQQRAHPKAAPDTASHKSARTHAVERLTRTLKNDRKSISSTLH